MKTEKPNNADYYIEVKLSVIQQTAKLKVAEFNDVLKAVESLHAFGYELEVSQKVILNEEKED